MTDSNTQNSSHSSDLDPGGLSLTTAQIDAAVREAVREAIASHAAAGNVLPVWRDGHIVHVPASVLLQEESGELPPS